MPDTCAALGCLNRRGRDCDVGFFRFPSPKLQGPRRKRWAAALRRFNDDGTPWEPTNASRICGDHFYTGRPQRARGHPDHVPSIFADRPARDSVWRQLDGVEGSRCSHTELQAPGPSPGLQAGTDRNSTADACGISDDENNEKLDARCATDNENHEKLDACGISDGENHEELDATSPEKLPATSRPLERNPAKAGQLPSIGNNMAGDVPPSADSGAGTRKLGPRVSPRQMEMLMEFLDEHPYLASTSREKGRGVKVFERELLWEEAAGKLNAKGPAVKSRSSWRKFWCSRSEQIKRTVARVAKMREESKQLPRAPPPPPPPPAAHPVAAEQGQLLLLLKQNGPCQPQRLLLPRLQQQLRLGTPGEAASVFVTAAGSPLPPAAAAAGAVHAQGTTPPNGVLLEPAGAVASGQQPEPDTGPPAAGTEEHFRAQMLHQTSQQTALLQGVLEEQRRIAEAAERQARALEEQSHAVSQLLLLMMGNQRHAAASSALLPDTPIALLTPDMVQVQHATPSAS